MAKAVLRLEVERVRKDPKDLIYRVYTVWRYFNFVKNNIPGENIDPEKYDAREDYYSLRMCKNIYYCDGAFEVVLKAMFGKFIDVEEFDAEVKKRIRAEVQHNTNFIYQWLAIDSDDGEILHMLAATNRPALVRMGVALNQCTESETRHKLEDDPNEKVREINHQIMR